MARGFNKTRESEKRVFFERVLLFKMEMYEVMMVSYEIGRSLVASFTDKFTSKEDTTESPPPSARKLSDGSPLDWLLQIKSPILTNTMNELRNSSLPERLVDMFEEKDGNTDCIKLLVCKMSPLIWGMQRACNATIEPEEQTDEVDVGNNGKGLNSFYKYLPDMQEFSTHGDACESRRPTCYQSRNNVKHLHNNEMVNCFISIYDAYIEVFVEQRNTTRTSSVSAGGGDASCIAHVSPNNIDFIWNISW
ncbi:hypothetical protein HA402_010614 [Bradysia odoriphaga]|nr:hypothetical protein HA402_010614 [Bradysia odoriphaga]